MHGRHRVITKDLAKALQTTENFFRNRSYESTVNDENVIKSWDFLSLKKPPHGLMQEHYAWAMQA